MKKINLAAAGIVIGVVAGFLLSGIASAQTATPDVTALQSAVVTLNSVETARQAIVAEVSAQIGNIVLQLNDIPSSPLTTANERAATEFQVVVLANQLGALSAVLTTTDAIQSQEAALLTSVQAELSGQ